MRALIIALLLLPLFAGAQGTFPIGGGVTDTAWARNALRVEKTLRLLLMANGDSSVLAADANGKVYNFGKPLRVKDSSKYVTPTALSTAIAGIPPAPTLTASNGVTRVGNDFRGDTSVLRTVANSYSIAQTNSLLAGKLNASDTTSLSNRIDQRVRYGDTAAMLSPYLRSTTAAATYQPLGSYATTSQLATKYNTADTAGKWLPLGYTSVIAGKVSYGDTSGTPGLISSVKRLNDSTASVRQFATNLAATKEPVIVAGTTAQYWRGDKTWQTLNTDAVPEGTNQYFTIARARTALTSGYAWNYNSTSGAGNVDTTKIPKYTGQALGTDQFIGTNDNFNIGLLRQGVPRLIVQGSAVAINNTASPYLSFRQGATMSAAGTEYASIFGQSVSAGMFYRANVHTWQNLAGTQNLMILGANGGAAITGTSTTTGNALNVTASDATALMKLLNTGQIVLSALPEFADDAAANTASRYKNSLYRTGSFIKICVACTAIAP